MLPAEWTRSVSDTAGNGTATDERLWWRAFGNDELNGLIERALTNSPTVRQAWARLEQARAAVREADAPLLPTLTLSGDASRSRNYTKTDSIEDASVTGAYSAGLAASYEVDLWNRLGARSGSKVLAEAASAADAESAAVSLAASVAETWVGILSVREQIRIVNAQLAVNEDVLRMQELRLAKSLGTGLDVLQQREAVAATRASLPPLHGQEGRLLNALAVLCGEVPSGAFRVETDSLPGLPGVPETGVPADLLGSRPDIRAAWARLLASDLDIESAEADRLPSLTLSASSVMASATLDYIFQNWALKLAAAVTAPIFDGGARRARVDAAEAVAVERFESYRSTVLTALREVEDALVLEAGQREHVAALEAQFEAARMAYDEARRRYVNGYDNFLAMLTQQRTMQSVEQNLVKQRQVLLEYRISLYRSLGGDWARATVPGAAEGDGVMFNTETASPGRGEAHARNS